MSPVLLLALALQAPSPGQDAGPQLDALRDAYVQSCGDRAYGTFDDVCTQMSDQIRAYERETRRASRPAPRKAAPSSARDGDSPPAAQTPSSAPAALTSRLR